MEDGDWLAATTAVLLARHPDEARHRLAAALLRSVDGTVAVRFSVVRTRSSLQVEVTPLLGASAPARDYEADALDGELAFVDRYRSQGRLVPLSLSSLVRSGYEMSALGRRRMSLLGDPVDLLCLPLGGDPEAHHGWFLGTRAPVRPALLGRLLELQGLVGALDAHAWPGPARGTSGMGPRPRLTVAEGAVLTHMSAGLTAAAIARRLGISPRTVHKHLEHVYRKLGTHDRLSTVLEAQRCGLLAWGHSPGSSHVGSHVAMPAMTEMVSSVKSASPR